MPLALLASYTEAMREAGSDIRFAPSAANHVGVLASGLPEAIAWADAVMIHERRNMEHIAVPSGRFRLLDATGDGYLRRDDYQAFALRLVQSLNQAPRSPKAAAVRDGYLRLWRAMSEADSDGDGQVSETEYLQWIGDAARGAGFDTTIGPLARSVIGLVDDNGNGNLGRDELMRLLTACNLTPEAAEGVICELDTDGSGEVSVEEIVAAVLDYCLGGRTAGSWLFGRF